MTTKKTQHLSTKNVFKQLPTEKQINNIILFYLHYFYLDCVLKLNLYFVLLYQAKNSIPRLITCRM